MKIKEKKELQGKSVAELRKLIHDSKTKLFSYQMEKASGKLADLRIMSKTRDDIARAFTVLTAKMKGEAHA